MRGRNFPLNGKQLAEAMGQSEGFVSAMKASGYVFEYGTKTTLAHALRWRSRNKDFRTTGYYRAHRQRPGDAQVEPSSKSHELAHSNGQ
jgi:hypothetical protein